MKRGRGQQYMGNEVKTSQIITPLRSGVLNYPYLHKVRVHFVMSWCSSFILQFLDSWVSLYTLHSELTDWLIFSGLIMPPPFVSINLLPRASMLDQQPYIWYHITHYSEYVCSWLLGETTSQWNHLLNEFWTLQI